MKDIILSVDFSSYIPLYKQIHDQVVFALETNALKPGDKLYPINKLAKELDVCMNTVSKAYRMLELEGYIIKRRGFGAYIAKKK